MNQTTFNFDAGAALKDQGQQTVEENNAGFMEQARALAAKIASVKGTVTSDDVRKACELRGIQPKHQNAWGALFRRGFEFTGERRRSSLPSNHSREVKVWRIKP